MILFFSPSIAAASAMLVEIATNPDDLILDSLDGILDTLGVLGGVACKIADVRGNDGEAFAEFAGASRFNRSVHGQHIGLDRHGGDRVDDLVDPPADLFEGSHLLRALFACHNGGLNAFHQRLDGRNIRSNEPGSELALLKSGLGQFLGRQRSPFNLGYGSRRLMGGSALLLRAFGDLLKRRHDFGGRAIDLLNGTRHFFRGRCHLLGALADIGAVFQLVGEFRNSCAACSH